MRHEYSPELLADPARLAVARQVADRLDRESAGTFLPADAAWTVAGGVPDAVVVVIRDETGVNVARQWSARDLADPADRSVARLWDEVVVVRSQNLIRNLAAQVEAEEVVAR